jgi:3-isopropylmalate dehydrogenase
LKIAVLAGDGIGPEITAQALRVVQALARHGLRIETESALVGGAAYDALGDPLPPQTLAVCESRRPCFSARLAGPLTIPSRARCAPSRACFDCASTSTCSPT